MIKAPAKVRKIVRLTFPPEISDQPLVYNLVRRYDLEFNILQAKISPNKEGSLTLELSGKPDLYRAGIEYLRENKISARLVSRSVSRDENACMHCGACTALCPTKALSVDPVSRLVRFNKKACTACGQCAQVCPVHAPQVEAPL